MPLQAATVEILIEKAKFPPHTAVAIAEAIDMALSGADLVTVPILEARFATFGAEMNDRFAKIDARFLQIDSRFEQLRSDVKADMQEIKAELVRWVFLVMLGNVALCTAATAIVNALQQSH